MIRSRISVLLTLSLFCLLPVREASAQARASAYFDIGSSQVSEGLFFKTALLAEYSFGKNTAGGGIQADVISNNLSFLSGFNLHASRQFRIGEFPFNIRVFYVDTRYLGVLREWNWGGLFSLRRSHFGMDLGTNFRTYAFTQEGRDLYGINENFRLRENLNLMYTFSYSLKPSDSPWNIALAMTNTDHFSILQETNPVFNLKGHYRASPTLDLFLESWYKSAGAFNLSVNYFGFFFRGGMVWDIR